jgi:hypothetical protein
MLFDLMNDTNRARQEQNKNNKSTKKKTRNTLTPGRKTKEALSVDGTLNLDSEVSEPMKDSTRMDFD